MAAGAEEYKTGRIPGLDLARGLAVLVMVVLNFRGVLGDTTVTPLWLDAVLAFLDRRAAAALVMISGAGITLYARAGWSRERQRELVSRGIFLMLAGSLLSLIWSGDILHVYGVLICMGAFLAGRASRFLICAALLFFAAGSLRWLPLFDLIEEGGGTLVWDGVADLFFSGYFPLFPWAAVFISGMLLGRLDLGRRPVRQILWGLGIGFFCLAGAISIILPEDWAQMDLALPTLPAMASGMGTGLCLILAAVRIPAASWCRYAAAAGRTSLTFYIVHILVLAVLDPWAGRSGLGNLSLICAGALMLYTLYAGAALWWLSRFGRGPLEQVMRQFPFIRPVRQGPALTVPARL